MNHFCLKLHHLKLKTVCGTNQGTNEQNFPEPMELIEQIESVELCFMEPIEPAELIEQMELSPTALSGTPSFPSCMGNAC
jgi:hypothetical protein